MSKLTISQATMRLDRETKGAVLYKNVDDGMAITSLYLRKDGIPTPYPQNIVVTVAAGGPDIA